MRLRVRLVFAVAALVTIAWAQSPRWQGTFEERDGVVYVTNPDDGLWAGRDPLPVRFVLEQVYGEESEPPGAVIGGVVGLAVDDEENVYVLDYYAKHLVSFDRNGGVRWTGGRAGAGPGEFLDGNLGLAWDGRSTLYCSTQDGTRLDLWSTAGEFIETRSLATYGVRSRATVVGFVQPTYLVLVDSLPAQIASEVIVLDVDDVEGGATRFVAEGGPFDRASGETSAPIGIQVGGGLILAGNLGAYSLSVFDLSGNHLRVVTRPVDYLRLPGRADMGTRSSGRMFGQLSPPVVLENDFWLVQASWPTNVEDPSGTVRRMMADSSFEIEWATSLDLFDAEGRFLLSLREQGSLASSIGYVNRMDTGGRLYTVSNDPFPHVRRYRVEIDP